MMQRGMWGTPRQAVHGTGARRRVPGASVAEAGDGGQRAMLLALGLVIAALAWVLTAGDCAAGQKKAKTKAQDPAISARTEENARPIPRPAKPLPRFELNHAAPTNAPVIPDTGLSLRLGEPMERPRNPVVTDPLAGSTSAQFGETRLDMGWKLKGDTVTFNMKPGGERYHFSSKVDVSSKALTFGMVMPF